MNSKRASGGVGDDVLGGAIASRFFDGGAEKIELFIDGLEDESMSADHFFRDESQMNHAEVEALSRCRGAVLDVGAGAGCHALVLQGHGQQVVALEKSASLCAVLRARGVAHVVESDVMAFSEGKFDTILLLMNGFGIAGSEEGVVELLVHLKSLLAPGGKILGDSTDIRYYREEGDLIDLAKGPMSEVEFEVRYGGETQRFRWVYPDEVLLEALAEEAGLKFETIMYSDEYHFLCQLYA